MDRGSIFNGKKWTGGPFSTGKNGPGSIFNGEKWTGRFHLTQGGPFSTAKSGPGVDFQRLKMDRGVPF